MRRLFALIVLLVFGSVAYADYEMSDSDKRKYLGWIKAIGARDGALAVAPNGCYRALGTDSIHQSKRKALASCQYQCNSNACKIMDVNGTSAFINQRGSSSSSSTASSSKNLIWCVTSTQYNNKYVHYVTKTGCAGMDGKVYGSKYLAQAERQRQTSGATTTAASSGAVTGSTASSNVKKLKETKSCPRCDLADAQLRAMDLTGANLTGANLTGATLYGANLAGADLTGAKLYKTILSGAKLPGVNLTEVDLTRVVLTGVDLTGANLREVNLRGVDLTELDLAGVNLTGANLREANLTGANLSRAKLFKAILAGANLREVNLTGVDLSGVDLTELDLAGVNLTGANLREVNLRGVDLTELDLTGVDLAGASLREVNLRGVDLTEANLTGANLTGAKLTGANLTGAKLPGVNLTEVDLTGVVLTGVDLAGADLTKVDLPGVALSEANLREANLTGANLSRAKLFKAILAGANLTGADLTGVDLAGANLREVNLAGVDLTEVNLTEANLTGANLAGAKLFKTILSGASLTGIDLSRVDLTWVDLTGVDLTGVDLTGVDLAGINLREVNLTGANLAEVDLTGVNLAGVDLTGADLTGAKLYKTILSGANLTGVNLAGAEICRTTMPDGSTNNSGCKEAATAPGSPPTATLTLRSNVKDDRVYIDGNFKGSTQLVLDLPKGQHTIRIEKDGYKAYEETIDLDQAITFKATLQKTTSQTDSADIVFWQAITGSSDPAMYRAYLKQFPAGVYAVLAKLKIKELGGDSSVTRSSIPNLAYGDYYALVIGNNEYQQLSPLRTAVNDARAVSTLLEVEYGFNVKLLENASRRDILRSLSGLREQVSHEDNILIYYAGHGYLDEAANEGFWLPVDAEDSDQGNWLATNRVVGQIKAMQAKHVMVVADSCFSGTLTRAIKIDQRTPEWLREIVKKKARTALTSGGLEPVMDSGGGNHSAFAHAFISLLEDNDGVLDAAQLFSELRPKVMVNSTQTPQYGKIHLAGDDGGDFLFVRH